MQCWDMVFVRPKFGLHVQALKPHVQFGVLPESKNSVSQEPHRANIKTFLPLFTLFPHRLFLNPSEGQGLRSLSPASQQAVQPGFPSSHHLFSSNSSWRRVAASSSSHQGNLLATQALSSSKLRLDVQQENLNQPLSCTTQQKPTRRFHTTSNGTAATSFFHFSRTVKHLGLMIYSANK